MNREQLAHVLRAAATVADDGEILVIGSQSVLGMWDVDDLPEEATLSVEADIAFRNDPGETKADRVDGAIGMESSFHRTFGYYGQGVVITTACRFVPATRHSSPAWMTAASSASPAKKSTANTSPTATPSPSTAPKAPPSTSPTANSSP